MIDPEVLRLVREIDWLSGHVVKVDGRGPMSTVRLRLNAWNKLVAMALDLRGPCNSAGRFEDEGAA